MNLSPIQLDFYYVEALSWKIEPGYKPKAQTPITLDDLKWNLERNDASEDGRNTAYRLTLCLSPADARYPYSFEIVVVGAFVLDAKVPDEQVALLLDVNAPTMLYSTAREVLASSLGRGPFPAPLLPSVHFMNLTREPQSEAAPTALPDQPPRPRKRRAPKAAIKT